MLRCPISRCKKVGRGGWIILTVWGRFFFGGKATSTTLGVLLEVLDELLGVLGVLVGWRSFRLRSMSFWGT